MRWSRYLPLGSCFALLTVLTLATALLLFSSPDEKRMSIYSNVANYSVSVVERDNLDYVALLELLEPLGTVTAKASGDHWRFRYKQIDSEFIAGKHRARVQGSDLDLPANFLLENGRGLVPISSLNALLPRFLGGPFAFNQIARRLFVGNVAIHFTAQIDKTTPSKLVMNFTSPVNPMIATEPGRLRMVFTHEAVVAPGSQTLTFNSEVIPSASFQESNGTAELLITGNAPMMASFSNDGRTITIAAPSTTPPLTQGQMQSPAGPPPPPTVIASTGAPFAGNKHVFAVVDAAHGGDERGAALREDLPEKDVTLAMARALRTEMTARGLTTLLLRDGDLTLSLDQRAATTNSSGAAIYLSLHATTEGSGVRLYTALMPSGAASRGPFLDWSTAQTASQATSQIAQAAVTAELRNKQVPVRSFSAPLRPLNNITAAALAIEISPTTNNVSQLTSVEYQQLIAGAVATGVAAIRDRLQAERR